MDNSRKDVLRQCAVVAAGELVCAGIMVGIYGAVGHYSHKVLWGALAGSGLALINFFALAVFATLAADKAEAGDVAGGQKLLKGSYPVRLLVVAALAVVLAKTGAFNVLALVLPLGFVHLILMLWSFFRKKGG